MQAVFVAGFSVLLLAIPALIVALLAGRAK
jgi:hypothetical protein